MLAAVKDKPFGRPQAFCAIDFVELPVDIRNWLGQSERNAGRATAA
jgi:hypothetical protein